MGKGSWFCSWKERAAALNRYRALSVSDELQSFYMPTAALTEELPRGSGSDYYLNLGCFFKKKEKCGIIPFSVSLELK